MKVFYPLPASTKLTIVSSFSPVFSGHPYLFESTKMSDLAVFLEQLRSGGRIQMSNPTHGFEDTDLDGEQHVAMPAWDAQDAVANAILLEMYRDAVHELVASPPALHASAASWSACLSHLICQLATQPRRSAEEIAAHRQLPASCPLNSSVVYSVDLTMRWLPEVAAIIRRQTPSDPLLQHLAVLADEWPLSFVGFENVAVTQPEELADTGRLPLRPAGRVQPVLGDVGLRQLYLDRIIRYDDVRCLTAGDESIRVELDTQLAGAPLAVAPKLRAALLKLENASR